MAAFGDPSVFTKNYPLSGFTLFPLSPPSALRCALVVTNILEVCEQASMVAKHVA